MSTLESIPVTVVGPGSQPEDEAGHLEFVGLPTEMDRYTAPELPDPEQVADLQGARAVTDWLTGALATYRVGESPQIADISTLDTENRELVNQILGEGEVSLIYRLGDLSVRMQESVLAGIWRTFYLDEEGRIVRDLIEVCDVPVLARRPPEAGTILRPDATPDDVMNALHLLTELEEKLSAWAPLQPAHVINLTLLPLSEADRQFLDAVLGSGPVETLSRGYGDCRITSTAIPGIWSLRFTNSMGKVILETLEVTEIPEVACAAREDLADSRQRFEALLEPYWTELQ